MPDVTFNIANRPYTLRCAEGQQDRLLSTAERLGAHIDALAARTGSNDDRMLLVMAALELFAERGEESGGAAESEDDNAVALRAWANDVADRLDDLATEVERLSKPALDQS